MSVCKILNLTQHSATPEQLEEGVVDLLPNEKAMLISLLTVDEIPSTEEILARCEKIALLAANNGLGGDDSCDPHPQSAMIGGAPWMMSSLEHALFGQWIEPVYAFSVRESVDVNMPDGTVRKMSVFKHAGFVPAVIQSFEQEEEQEEEEQEEDEPEEALPRAML